MGSCGCLKSGASGEERGVMAGGISKVCQRSYWGR